MVDDNYGDNPQIVIFLIPFYGIPPIFNRRKRGLFFSRVDISHDDPQKHVQKSCRLR